jgi:hypothetical protein
VTISGNVRVPFGVTLVVPNGKTLTVSGTIDVYGTLKAATLSSITPTGNGKVVFKHGTEGYYGNSLFISSDGGSYQWGAANTDTITLSANNTTTLAGTFTVTKDTRIETGTITKIAGGAALTLSPNITYTVAGTFDDQGSFVMGESGKVVFEHGAGYKKGTSLFLGTNGFYQWDNEPSASKITQRASSEGPPDIELTAGNIFVQNTTDSNAEWPIKTVAKGTTLTINNNATYQIATLDVKGTVNVKGPLKLTAASFWQEGSNGEYVFSAGAKAYTGGTTFMIGGSSDSSAIRLTTGTLSVIPTAYTLDGNATFLASFSLSNGQTLTVKGWKYAHGYGICCYVDCAVRGQDRG